MKPLNITTPGQTRAIGADSPTFLIAEMSGNHNGSLERAKQLIHAAADAGADAVKFQTYTADTMTIDADTKYFRISEGLWRGTSLYDLYSRASTPWEWHQELFAEAAARDLIAFSTPFDSQAVDLLESLDTPLHKVASFEIVDIPLLESIGATGKPVIVSTGMASIGEIDRALATLRNHGSTQLAVLYCLSAYPADPASLRLRNIPNLAVTFDVVTGLSDHSPGHAAAVAAVAMGAKIVEKHLTLDPLDGGPDSEFSLDPTEFKHLVENIRIAEAALENPVSYGAGVAEQSSIMFRRSIFFVKDLQVGHELTEDDVRIIRPGHGLKPENMGRIIGRRLIRDAERGTPVSWDAFV